MKLLLFRSKQVAVMVCWLPAAISLPRNIRQKRRLFGIVCNKLPLASNLYPFACFQHEPN